MSSMIHGIRILKKEGKTLTFRTYLIYSDWSSLPRTHVIWIVGPHGSGKALGACGMSAS